MQFKDIPGTSTVASSLRGLVTSDRLPGALLLQGQPGGNQLALALAMAQLALCQEPTTDDACGVCPSCHRTQKLIHPDLLFSFPYVNPKGVCDDHLVAWRDHVLANPFLEITDWLEALGAENKEGKIYASECSTLLRKLSLKTFEANRRMYIIWRPEYLGPGEGNRLLKLIEEPPAGTTFILVAENTELILPTILSRCQIVKIPLLADEEIAGYLHEKKGMAPKTALSHARLAEGNLNAALQLAEESREDLGTFFLNWFRKTWEGKSPALVEITEQIASWSRNRQKGLLQYGLFFLREVLSLKYQTIHPENVRLNPSDQVAAEKLGRLLTLAQMELLNELFSQSIGYLERNAHPKILFLSVGLRMHRIQRGKSLPMEAENISI